MDKEKLLALVRDLTAEDIPCQEDVFRVWTDAACVAYSGSGVPSGGVYMPRRCSHAPVEVADINDIANTAALLDAFLRRLEVENIEELVKFL